MEESLSAQGTSWRHSLQCDVRLNLLICVSCDRVPALVLIDVNVSDIGQGLLVHFVI